MNHRRAFSHVEVLIVVVILLILGIVAIPNYEEARTRRRVAQSLNDMATLGAAIEAYRTDRGTFPAMALLASWSGTTAVPAGSSAAGTSRTADWGPLSATGYTFGPLPGRTFRTNGARRPPPSSSPRSPRRWPTSPPIPPTLSPTCAA